MTTLQWIGFGLICSVALPYLALPILAWFKKIHWAIYMMCGCAIFFFVGMGLLSEAIS